jgi:hypothetical protein
VLRLLIPPPRLPLSEWIESNIRLPEGVSAVAKGPTAAHRARGPCQSSERPAGSLALRRTYPPAKGGGARSAPSLGATLTPGHIAIERAGDAVARLDAYLVAKVQRQHLNPPSLRVGSVDAVRRWLAWWSGHFSSDLRPCYRWRGDAVWLSLTIVSAVFFWF